MTRVHVDRHTDRQRTGREQTFRDRNVPEVKMSTGVEKYT